MAIYLTSGEYFLIFLTFKKSFADTTAVYAVSILWIPLHFYDLRDYFG